MIQVIDAEGHSIQALIIDHGKCPALETYKGKLLAFDPGTHLYEIKCDGYLTTHVYVPPTAQVTVKMIAP